MACILSGAEGVGEGGMLHGPGTEFHTMLLKVILLMEGVCWLAFFSLLRYRCLGPKCVNTFTGIHRKDPVVMEPRNHIFFCQS